MRVIVFLVTLLVLWLPLALPLYWLLYSDADLVAIVTMAVLYLMFMGLVQWWGQNIHNHPNLLQRYGLVKTRTNIQELFKGFSWGGGVCLGIFGLQGLFGWLIWRSPSLDFLQVTLEGLAIAVGVGFAEELLFRGWLLDELERDYSTTSAIWISAVIFALLHFLKPLAEIWRTLPQFPALIALGLILAWAKRSHQMRLGIAIGIHAGLVWGYYLIQVGGLVEYTQSVPTWITGIDGNPLAGLMGWLGLFILGYIIKSRSQPLN